MEISVLDSILNDNLKPWLIDNSNVKHFQEAIKNVNQIKCDNYNQLHEQIINILGNEFKHISKKINNSYSKQQTKLISNFYSIEFNQYTDTITQFYFLIISKETERIFNSFIIESKSWEDPIDIYYHATQTLLGIRVLASEVNEELIERNYNNNIPQDHIQYALQFLKIKLIALFFDIQELFKEHLNNIETIDTFCINYLGKIDTTIKLKPAESLIRFNLNKIINKIYENSELNKLLKLTESLKSENKNQIIAAIENYKFFIKTDLSINSIDDLLDTEIINKYFEEYKAEVLEKINTHNLGHQRLMIINEELEKNENPSNDTNNKFSISSKIYNWLIQQKEMYQQHASNIFSNEETAKVKATKLKSPLTKKSKANLSEQKQYASEHLKFLSGYNIKNEKIMSDAHFKQVLDYTYYLIEKEILPTNIEPIPQIGFASNAIRYTYYKIHQYLYGTQSIKEIWIDFLHEVFSQFKNTSKSTTKAKFSTKPPSYDLDIEQMKR